MSGVFVIIGDMRHLEIGGGQVDWLADGGRRLWLPATGRSYADAQLDDYGGLKRSHYPHRPGTTLSLIARFSHPAGTLRGTAGFGFWNAPYGDPTVGWPALPQAVWFFYASEPNDLPFGPGRGWFAATMDSGRWWALAWAPFAPLVVLLNRRAAWRKRLWPAVQRGLSVSYALLPETMNDWHHYWLEWTPAGCQFKVDNQLILQTPFAPRGPLGFVAWLDNQYLIASPTGRIAAGLLAIPQPQWLELSVKS